MPIFACLGLASVPQCLAWDALGTLLDALGTLLDALGTLLDAHGTLLDALGGVMLDKNHSTRAPKSDFSCPGLDFGRILVPPTMDFHAFIILLRSTALTFSKKPQPMKNIGKTKVFTSFSHFRVCAQPSKINRKTYQRRISPPRAFEL